MGLNTGALGLTAAVGFLRSGSVLLLVELGGATLIWGVDGTSEEEGEEEEGGGRRQVVP
jgi:hypothetical protein